MRQGANVDLRTIGPRQFRVPISQTMVQSLRNAWSRPFHRGTEPSLSQQFQNIPENLTLTRGNSVPVHKSAQRECRRTLYRSRTKIPNQRKWKFGINTFLGTQHRMPRPFIHSKTEQLKKSHNEGFSCVRDNDKNQIALGRKKIRKVVQAVPHTEFVFLMDL